MVTKKQLAALAYGRAVRKVNMRKRKTTNGKYRCKISKRKTREDYNDILRELENNGGDSATINVDGYPIDVHYGEPPEEKPTFWQKTKKFIAGAATVAALGALGIYGLNKAQIIDWKSLKQKLLNWGATGQQILGIEQALQEDTEEERQKNINDRMQMMYNGIVKDKGNVFNRIGTFISSNGKNLTDNSWANIGDKKYNEGQTKLSDIINNLAANVYDIDFNKLTNAINYIEKDIKKYDYDKGWTPNKIMNKLKEIQKFKNEYNNNIAGYDADRFENWVYGKRNELIDIFKEYNNIKTNSKLKK